jgi:hypothetical protein
MCEELYFLTIPETSDRRIFLHVHCPANSNGQAFIFLNPILDEKKKSQKFQVDTARKICALNYYVIRFDYYGTGDSGGESFEFDFYEALKDMQYLTEHMRKKYALAAFKILGIRLGADLAAIIAAKGEFISDLFLIEPVSNGLRYLTELRLKRKLFFKLSDMAPVQEEITINGEAYQDQLGYPLSETAVKFIEGIETHKIVLTGKRIFLFQVNSTSSKELFVSLFNHLAENNSTKVRHANCPVFWLDYRTTDTAALTVEIMNCLTT